MSTHDKLYDAIVFGERDVVVDMVRAVRECLGLSADSVQETSAEL